MPKLRTVKVFKFDRDGNEYIAKTNPGYPVISNYERSFVLTAKFHGFGFEIHEAFDGSVAAFTVALVELDNGDIAKVVPELIQFV